MWCSLGLSAGPYSLHYPHITSMAAAGGSWHSTPYVCWWHSILLVFCATGVSMKQLTMFSRVMDACMTTNQSKFNEYLLKKNRILWNVRFQILLCQAVQYHLCTESRVRAWPSNDRGEPYLNSVQSHIHNYTLILKPYKCLFTPL